MSEERSRILKLLEDGKITADQAARLIEALGRVGSGVEDEDSLGVGRHARAEERPGRHRDRLSRHHSLLTEEGLLHPPRPPRPVRVSMAELDRIPDIVAGAVTAAMKAGVGDDGELKTDFPDKSSLFLKSISGDVCVDGWDGQGLKISGTGGITKVREREDKVMIRSISGDFKVQAPKDSRLELVSVSGDVSVSGVDGKFGLKSASGDVELKGFNGEVTATVVTGDVTLSAVSGKFVVETKTGDIRFEPEGDFEGSLVSKSGDIELVLDPMADVVLDMAIEEDGEIEVDDTLAGERLEESDRRLVLRLGAGSRRVDVRTREADITVRQAKEA